MQLKQACMVHLKISSGTNLKLLLKRAQYVKNYLHIQNTLLKWLWVLKIDINEGKPIICFSVPGPKPGAAPNVSVSQQNLANGASQTYAFAISNPCNSTDTFFARSAGNILEIDVIVAENGTESNTGNSKKMSKFSSLENTFFRNWNYWKARDLKCSRNVWVMVHYLEILFICIVCVWRLHAHTQRRRPKHTNTWQREAHTECRRYHQAFGNPRYNCFIDDLGSFSRL